jgi:hypothetical protein
MSEGAGACICEEVLEDMDYWNDKFSKRKFQI